MFKTKQNRWLYSALFLMMLVFSSCAGMGKSASHPGSAGNHLWEYKKNHFNMYSLNDEIKIGEMVQKQQIDAFQKKGLAVDPSQHAKIKARVQRIVTRLAQASDMPGLPYEVHIYEKDDVVNAFCLPGGKIGVFTGLFHAEKGLVDPKSDDEIAAVLGHEIAHATLRHVTRRLTTYSGLNVIGGLVSVGIGQGAGGNWQYVFNQVFSTGAQLILPTYSRNHELEADKVGLYYMTKAGFDPQASVRIWERASQQAAKKGKTDKTHFLASHPGSSDRANTLRGYLADVEEVKNQMKLVEASKRER